MNPVLFWLFGAAVVQSPPLLHNNEQQKNLWMSIDHARMVLHFIHYMDQHDNNKGREPTAERLEWLLEHQCPKGEDPQNDDEQTKRVAVACVLRWFSFRKWQRDKEDELFEERRRKQKYRISEHFCWWDKRYYPFRLSAIIFSVSIVVAVVIHTVM